MITKKTENKILKQRIKNTWIKRGLGCIDFETQINNNTITNTELKDLLNNFNNASSSCVDNIPEDLSQKQLIQVLKGVVDGVDILVFAKTCFNPEQMEQIRIGQVNNIDVSHYAHDHIDARTMEIYRSGLELNIDHKILDQHTENPNQLNRLITQEFLRRFK